MILVVLLVMMLSVALLIFVTWRTLGFIERMAARAGLEKSIPVFGGLSIAATLFGFLGVAIGVGTDTGAGAALALFALGFGPLLGIGFGLAALFTRERPAALPVLGLFGNLAFALFFLLR